MHEVLAVVSGWLVHYLAHSAIALMIVGASAWLGDRLLRSAGPQAQHRMWVAALLTATILPLLPASMLTGFFSHADAGVAGETATVTYHMIAVRAEGWSLAPFLFKLLGAAYLLTVLLSVARLLWGWWRTRAMVRLSALLTLDGVDREVLESAARRLGVTIPAVRCSAETRGPVVLGLRRAVLVVPEGFFAAEGSADVRIGNGDVAAALAHECAHIARRDYGKNLLYALVAAAVAYHPACRLMRRRIAETREMVCDEMAAGTVDDRPEYASSLLRLATAMAVPTRRASHAIGVFDANILEERIMRLTMDVPTVSRTRKVAMAVVTACALLGGVATAAALSFEVTPQDGAASAASAHEKVYTVGGDVSAPKLTHSVDAEYPKKERSKVKGNTLVVCSLIVSSDGSPRDIQVKQSAGNDFDQKAMDAIRQYRFDPAMRQGVPVAVAITIEVNFHIY